MSRIAPWVAVAALLAIAGILASRTDVGSGFVGRDAPVTDGDLLATGTPGVGSPDGRIAFTSRRDGNGEIYVIDADGTGLTRLTNDPGEDWGPSWSPDGQKIAFESQRPYDGNVRNGDIYVMNADGTGLTILTDDPNLSDPITSSNWLLGWRSNGQQIEFRHISSPYVEGIYRINVDGTGLTRLTDEDPLEVCHSLSPDDRTMALLSGRDGSLEIYIGNTDGTGHTRLTNEGAELGCPIFSPDGERITFTRRSDADGNRDIYLMNVDGTNITNITDSPNDDVFPIWSPDGRKIAYESEASDAGTKEIYVIDLDGTGPTRLTNNPGYDGTISWSPDSRMIAFTSDRAGNVDIYLIYADGTGLTRLTYSPSIDGFPSWGPSGP